MLHRDSSAFQIFDADNYTITAIPTSDQNGVATITVSMTDSDGSTANRSFDLTVTAVQDSPVIGAISDQIIGENTVSDPISFTVVDVDADNLTLSGSSSNLTLLAIENIAFSGTGSSRTLTITPTSNEIGTALISIAVTDGNFTATSAFNLTVVTVNAPIIGSISDQMTNEDTAINSISFTATDIEDSPCSMSITLTSSDQTIVSDAGLAYTCNADNYTITVTPLAHQNGSVTITVLVTDSWALTASTSFSLSVAAMPDAPIISDVDAYTMDKNSVSDPIEFTMYDPDANSLTMTVSASSSNTIIVANENISISGTGGSRTLTITPTTDEVGTVSITLIASDSFGLTSTKTFSVLVTPDYYGVTKIAAEYYYSVVLKTDGTVWATGFNSSYQLGIDVISGKQVPFQTHVISDITDISCGHDHAMALKNDGTVWAWGSNSFGQIGDNTTTQRTVPVQITAITNVTAIAAGYYHSLALKNDGTVWAWGKNDYGALGDNSTTQRNAPVQVSGLTNVIVISGGGYHSIALKDDGTVWAWGRNNIGQLGDTTQTDRTSPVQVSGLSNISFIAAGENHSAALTNDRNVWLWGYNNYGQLGDGTTSYRTTPIQLASLSNIIDIAPGKNHTTAINTDGQVLAWGRNNYGQFGNDTTTDSSIPITITTLSNIIDIATGENHSLALRNDMTVWGSGQNAWGQLGDETGTQRTLPVLMHNLEKNYIPVISTISDVTTNEDTSVNTITFNAYDINATPCSLTISMTSSDQTLFPDENLTYSCDSDNYTITANPADEQNGMATITVLIEDSDGLTSVSAFSLTVTSVNDAPTITDIPKQSTNVNTSINSIQFLIGEADGDDITLTAQSSSLTLVAIENMSFTGTGSLRSMTITPTTDETGVLTVTVIVSDSTGLTASSAFSLSITNRLVGVSKIAAAYYYSLALKNDGTVWGTGFNSSYQLGIDTTSGKQMPVQALNIDDITELSCGHDHVIALDSNRNIWAWGQNSFGQHGDGTTTQKTIAAQITSITNVVAIASGFYHTLALKNDGTVWSWGKNDYGALGDGTTTQRTSPVQVSSLSNIIAISGGGYHSIALKNDGTVWAWGRNNSGQLGDTTQTDSSIPVEVYGLTNIIFIAAGENHSAALTDEGNVWVWGYNNYGQLGDGTTTYRTTPVMLSTLNNIRLIAPSENHTLALTYGGQVMAWGRNIYGQFGDGTTTDSTIPITITSLSDIIDIAVGENHSLALKYDMTVWGNGQNAWGQLGDETGTQRTSPVQMHNLEVNYYPIISSISGQTINENSSIDTITFNASDIETSPCSLSMTITSSDQSLIPDGNISSACSSGLYTLTITPASDQNGTSTITVLVTDDTGLTVSSVFSVNVDSVNNAPVISTIPDQTTLEDIATSIISFTATDLETAASSLILTMTSSDQTLVPDEYLLYESNAGQYSIVATPAFNQAGTVEISVTITDGGGLAASTTFNLTVTDVDDNVYMWANNQAADVVLGQSDFTSNYTGTTSNTLNYPSAVAVDPTTGKVFISDRYNHRILRFSSISAAISGSSAEAVFGQTDFTSGQENRGGSVAANTLGDVDGLIVDPFGHLWVSDFTNNRVLRFNNASTKASGSDADGVLGQPDFTTYTSDRTQNKMDGPISVWFDPAGKLWVSELNNNRVLRFDDVASKSNGANADAVLGQSDFVSFTTGTTQNSFQWTYGVFVNNSDTLFVSDFGNYRNLCFDNASLKLNGANADSVLGQSDYISRLSLTTITNMKSHAHSVMDNSGRLYLSDFDSNRIIIVNDVLNKANGAAADNVLGQTDFTSNAANNGGVSERSLNNPVFIYFDNINRCLWVADFGNHRVLRYTIMVKTEPVLSLISDSVMNEDTVSNSISFTVTDINEQALTITYSSSDVSIISSTGITFSGDQVSSDGNTYTVTATAIETTVTLTVTPESNQSGSALITITVIDSDEMSASNSFRLTVTQVNDQPEIGSITHPTIDEDTAINSLSFTVTDIETAGCSHGITFASSDTGLIPVENISYTCNADIFYLSMTPVSNQSGNATITITITDAGNLTASESFIITVNEINDPPTLSTISNQSTTEDNATGAINFTVSDAEGDNLTVSANSSNLSLVSIENIVISGTGLSKTLMITPTANEFGVVTITIAVTDGELTSISAFELSITAVNDVPIISGINTQMTQEDTAIQGISFTVTDIDNNDNSLIVTGESSNISLVTMSNITFDGTGSNRTVAITPVANENGAISITVAVSDSDLTATTSFTFNIEAVNDSPVNTVMPTISGFYHFGQTLTINDGSWNDDIDKVPGTLIYSYQWQRADDAMGTNTTNIDTSQAYTLTLADNAKY
ncbi:hypothetical protein MHK_009515, partial [Candidatus Magnetomorum sp. HK-1]